MMRLVSCTSRTTGSSGGMSSSRTTRTRTRTWRRSSSAPWMSSPAMSSYDRTNTVLSDLSVPAVRGGEPDRADPPHPRLRDREAREKPSEQ